MPAAETTASVLVSEVEFRTTEFAGLTEPVEICAVSADGVGEEAAVAAELLYALRAWATATAGKPPRDTDGGRAFAAHASAVRHMLDLWERGREVPGL